MLSTFEKSMVQERSSKNVGCCVSWAGRGVEQPGRIANDCRSVLKAVMGITTKVISAKWHVGDQPEFLPAHYGFDFWLSGYRIQHPDMGASNFRES